MFCCSKYALYIFLLLTPTQLVSSEFVGNGLNLTTFSDVGNASSLEPPKAFGEDTEQKSESDIMAAQTSLMCDEVFGNVSNASQTTPKVADQASSSIAWKVEYYIYLYGAPVLIVVGVIGNSMAAVTLQSRLFNKTPSTRFILTALTLCEISLLLIPFLRIYLETAYVIRIRNVSSFGCKLHCFLTYVSRHLSSWTLILLTLERTISVYFPFRCKQICSHKNVVCIWVAFVIALFVINFHFFWSVDIIHYYKNTPDICAPISSWEGFVVGPWYWIDISLVDLIPFVVIITGNVLIISKTIRAQRARAIQMQASVGASNIVKSQVMTSTTYILILVSVVFLLTHAPNDAYYIASYFNLFSQLTFGSNLELQLFYDVANIVYYINCAVEFILYFFGGRKFRLAFMDMFGIRKATKY